MESIRDFLYTAPASWTVSLCVGLACGLFWAVLTFVFFISGSLNKYRQALLALKSYQLGKRRKPDVQRQEYLEKSLGVFDSSQPNWLTDLYLKLEEASGLPLSSEQKDLVGRRLGDSVRECFSRAPSDAHRTILVREVELLLRDSGNPTNPESQATSHGKK